MSTEHRKRIFNYRTESGKAPDPANIAYGEIAINYKGEAKQYTSRTVRMKSWTLCAVLLKALPMLTSRHFVMKVNLFRRVTIVLLTS